MNVACQEGVHHGTYTVPKPAVLQGPREIGQQKPACIKMLWCHGSVASSLEVWLPCGSSCCITPCCSSRMCRACTPAAAWPPPCPRSSQHAWAPRSRQACQPNAQHVSQHTISRAARMADLSGAPESPRRRRHFAPGIRPNSCVWREGRPFECTVVPRGAAGGEQRGAW